jgi:hypothetical protein
MLEHLQILLDIEPMLKVNTFLVEQTIAMSILGFVAIVPKGFILLTS